MTRWHALHLITRLDVGGAQFATLTEVAKSRFVTGERHLAYGADGGLAEEARRTPGIDVHHVRSLVRQLHPRDDARAVWEVARLLRRLMQRHPGDRWLVHTHSSKAGIVGRLAARLARADLVVHSVHGFGHSHHATGVMREVLRLAEVVVARAADGFTADSAANVAQGEREGLFGGRPARVVHCGIDVAAWQQPQHPRAEVRRALGIAADAPLVCNVSCLKPQKDPETYVRVAAFMLERLPSARFLLVGDGELRPRVEALIDELHLRERVLAVGWRRDVRELMHASDLLLLTSRWEGLPQVLAQAMAAGLPIVASDVDGNPEAVSEGETGRLCSPGDVDAFALAALDLLSAGAKRLAMAERARELVHRFSEETMLRTLDAYYAELAGDTRREANLA